MPTPRHRALVARLAALAVCTTAACVTVQARKNELVSAVNAYNQFLRWKKFDGALVFRLPEDQADFMARYSEAEDDLNIDSIETRAVSFPPGEEGAPTRAEVVVVAHAYLLPSTVLEKVVMKQTWEHRDGRWVLIESSRELAPPVSEPPAGKDTLQAPPEGTEGLGAGD